VNIIVWPSIAEEQRSALLTVQGTWQSEKGVHTLVAATLVDDSALLGRLRVSTRDFR
jgi:error-prone DNA polymerase